MQPMRGHAGPQGTREAAWQRQTSARQPWWVLLQLPRLLCGPRPPELILGHDRYGPEVDMWSVGCIFAELLMGKALFPGKDDPDQIDRITKLCGSITEDTTPGCKRFPQ